MGRPQQPSEGQVHKRPARSVIKVFFLLVLVAATLGSAPQTAEAVVPGAEGIIAFSMWRDGAKHIFTIRPDGTGLNRITNGAGIHEDPSFAPDGLSIVYTLHDPYQQIMRIGVDGGNPVRIASHPDSGTSARLSPDAQSIAFVSSRFGLPEILIMDAYGTNQRRITADVEFSTSPEWSPDGSQIAFTRGTADAAVWLMNSDGTNQREVLDGAGNPSWSPDGSMIALEWNGGIAVIPSDGTGTPTVVDPSNRPPSGGIAGLPSWSPTGERLVVSTNDGLEMWPLDGSEAFEILADPTATSPAWQSQIPAPMGLVDTSAGLWHLRDASGLNESFFYGNPGDMPFLGDWDCDGVDSPGLYRQSDGYVYLRNSNTQGIAERSFFFGNPGDVPLSGDFNGDGCDTVSLYRPSEQRFYIINHLGTKDKGLGKADIDYVFGNPGDIPFVGDFDGDGIDTAGLHRASTGLVYYRNTHSQGPAEIQFLFGDPQDRFITNDWNGNGVDSPAVFRPSNTTHYFRFTNTQGPADTQYNWGKPHWRPVTGTYSHD